MKCSKCDNEIPDGSEFCNNCGKRVIAKCSKCGKEIPEGSHFCNFCGKRQSKGNKWWPWILAIVLLLGVVVIQRIMIVTYKDKIITYNEDIILYRNSISFVDLGLPSGTKWKSVNEEGLYDFVVAVTKYGTNLPTREQLRELKDQCKWEWVGKGYRVVGPNGNSIVLPAAGWRSCDGDVYGVGFSGDYWSSTPRDSDYAWFLNFTSISVYMNGYGRRGGKSVRLVQD